MNILLWGVIPYITLFLVIGGTMWRYRFDKFGWTTRSSELYESRLLRIASPLFHYGVLVAAATLVGCGLLIYRRRRTGPVFMATTRNDKLMYAALVSALLAGTFITLVGTVDPHGEGVNYRETVSPWFRSIFYLNPDIDAMSGAPLRFHVHVLIGMTLFCLVPFTRLVHIFTAPLHYLFRPYIVYRSRDRIPAPGARPARRGWAPIGVKDRDQ